MKSAVKEFVGSHALFSWLVKPAQWALGLRFTIRGHIASQILRIRLVTTWLSARKPLLVFARFGGIGDIICTFPAFDALSRQFPSCYPVYVTLRDYSIFPSSSGLDMTVIGSARHCAVPWLPRKVMAHCYEPRTAKELRIPTSARSLIAEFFEACGLPPEDRKPRLAVSPAAEAAARHKVNVLPSRQEKIVVIHTGPSWRTREWPEEQWQELIDRLHGHFPLRILHVGAEQHVTLGQQKVEPLSGVERLIGKLTLDELTALISTADLFIGIDSGMLHIAGAFGIASIGLFGPTAPEYVRPGLKENGFVHALPCSFCDYRIPVLHWQSNCPHEIACMKGITVDQVYARCIALLDPGDRPAL